MATKDGHMVEVMPIYREERKEYFAEGVEPVLISNIKDQILNRTAPLRFDKRFDLLGITQTKELLDEGILKQTDVLNFNIRIKNIWFRKNSTGSLICVSLQDIPLDYQLQDTTNPALYNYRTRAYHFVLTPLILDSSLELVPHKHDRVKTVEVFGDVNFETGETGFYCKTDLEGYQAVGYDLFIERGQFSEQEINNFNREIDADIASKAPSPIFNITPVATSPFIKHLAKCSKYQPMTFDAIKDILYLYVAKRAKVPSEETHVSYIELRDIHRGQLIQDKLMELGFYRLCLSGNLYLVADIRIPELIQITYSVNNGIRPLPIEKPLPVVVHIKGSLMIVMINNRAYEPFKNWLAGIGTQI